MIWKTFFKINKYGFRAVFVLLIVFVSINLFAQKFDNNQNQLNENGSYVEEIVKTAKETRLSNDPYWHLILHYKKKNIGGYESLIDDPSFFFATDGKTNPESEMEGTIRAFFSNPEKGKIHPTAKFSARYKWLKNKLNIDVSRLPYDGDDQFNKFYNEIAPSKVTVVFPAGFMSSPASMYGHTFLIIESKNGNRLLSKTANYAANTDDKFGPLFAFKGLFGFYKGYFSYAPYHQKIREYSNGEMRDMWEYELDLSSEQIENMMRHIVELESIYSDYYFIDENCSFNLLFLIEVARPETSLTDYFGIGVEPIDTVRVIRDNGLIKNRTYRPSLYSKVQYLRSKLSWNEQQLVLDICNGEKPISALDSLSINDEKKIIISDLCVEYLKFKAVKNDITEEQYRERFISVLNKRNEYSKSDSFENIPVPPGPEESHLSRRMAIESGYALRGYYSAVSYRQSAHELMDPDEGYNKNSQIVFGNVSGRYYYKEKELKLHRFDFIDLISLPTSDLFYLSPCYNFRVGFIQNPWKDKNEKLSFNFNGLGGFSTTVSSIAQLYAFGGIKSYFSPSYEKNTDLQIGGETGVLTITGPFKNHLFFQYFKTPFGINHTIISAGISERIRLTQTVSILGDYTFNKNFSYNYHEVSLKLNFYF